MSEQNNSVDNNEPIMDTADVQPITGDDNFKNFYNPQKKKSGVIISIIAISLVLVLGIGSFAAWTLFKPDIKVMLWGTKKYWDTLERSNASIFKDLANTNMNSTEWNKYKTEMKLAPKVNAGDSQIPEAALGYINDSTLEFNTVTDTAAKKYATETKLTVKNLISVSAETVTENNKTYVRVPQANKQYIDTEAKTAYGASNISEVLKNSTGKDFTELAAIFEGYYKDAVMANIDESKITFDSKASYEGMGCNSLSVSLDKDTMTAIMKSISEKMKNDDQWIDILYNVRSNVNPVNGEKITKEDIKKQVKSAAENLVKEDTMKDYKTTILTVWFDKNEKIIAREMADSDFSIKMHYYTKEDKIYALLKMTDFENKKDMISFTAEGTMGATGFSGKANLAISEGITNIGYSSSYSGSSSDTMINISWENNAQANGINTGKITITSNSSNENTTPVLIEYSCTANPLLSKVMMPAGTYKMTITPDTDQSIIMDLEIKEVEKNLKYDITAKLSGSEDVMMGATVELNGNVLITKLETTTIPDINEADTIKMSEVDTEDYFGQFVQDNNLDSILGGILYPSPSYNDQTTTMTVTPELFGSIASYVYSDMKTNGNAPVAGTYDSVKDASNAFVQKIITDAQDLANLKLKGFSVVVDKDGVASVIYDGKSYTVPAQEAYTN